MEQIDINGTQIPELTKLANSINCKSYLEIGILHGSTLLSIPTERRTGVDICLTDLFLWNLIKWREINKIITEKEPHIKVWGMPSDEFFKKNTDGFDLVFIDGLHEKSQVLRDINNSLGVLNIGGFIVCHDTIPIDELSSNPTAELKPYWCGNVFKAIIELRVKRPDLEIYTIPVPCGLTVIKKTDSSQLMLDEKYLTYEFKEFDKEKELILNIRK